MATATFIHDGNAIDYTPGSDVSAGDVVVQHELVGVTKRDIPANTLGALAVTGVFDFPKPPIAFIAGEKAYWDDSAAVPEAAGNTYIGKAVKAAAEGDGTVRVRLDQ